MLAHSCSDDRIPLGQFHQEFNHMLWLDSIRCVLVAERMILLPFVDLLVPSRETGVPILDRLAAGSVELLVKARKGILHITKDREFYSAVLIDFRVINVDVDDRAVLAEFLHLAGHAIVETDTDGKQQIGFIDGIVGIDRAMHAKPLKG